MAGSTEKTINHLLQNKRKATKLASLQTGPKWDMAVRQQLEEQAKQAVASSPQVVAPLWGSPSDDEHRPGEGASSTSRWMIPYADLLTLLLGLFLVLYAWSVMPEKPEEQTESTQTKSRKTVSKVQSTKGKVSKDAAKSNPLTKVPGIKSTILAKLQAQKGIRVWEEARGTVISMNDSLLFPASEADVTDSTKKTLDQFANSLKAFPNPVRVEGHTDNSPIQGGKYPSNWELSTARATNVVRYLINQHGIPPTRLTASGYGEFRPIAQNSTIEGKQKNRRVDIVILNALTGAQEPQAVSSAQSPKSNAQDDPSSVPKSPGEDSVSSSESDISGNGPHKAMATNTLIDIPLRDVDN